MTSGLLSCLRPVLVAVLLTGGLVPAHAQQPAQQQLAQQHLQGRRLAHGANAARALDAARREHAALLAQPRAASLSAPWTAVGPAQIATQTYGSVTGRITAIALDPADPTGNTVYLGTTGGGVWKSTNAAGDAASVLFQPLTDTLPVFNANAGSAVIPSLSIGAVAVGGGIVLAGTGDTNDATDSYYGAGILRSADAGSTWTLIQSSQDGAAGNHDLFGLGFAAFAFSTADPSLVVAAASQAAEGILVNAPDAANRELGLYYSADAGLTWHMATLLDGAQTVQAPTPGNGNGGNAATAVVWNAARQRFYAAIRFHGYYQSSDGIIWTRLPAQPGVGLTTTACPANPAVVPNTACPIFRGALAVQPATGDLFALTTDSANRDTGLYQDLCALNGAACANSTVTFAVKLPSSALEAGSGSTVIPQADYDLTLAAVPLGTDTLLYAGTVDLYRCTLAAGCVLRNTTNAQNGCLTPAGVFPSQHALTALGSLLYLGNDGGLYRSSDAVAQTGPACSATDATHFQNLNPALRSLAEIAAFAQDPVAAGTLLTGLGALGTAATSSASGPPTAWPQLSTGEGSAVAIDPVTPANWYLSLGAGMSVGFCAKGPACVPADFTPTVGEPQVANDATAIHAAWILDPAAPTDLIAGTCRAWRGPAQNAAGWTTANLISKDFSGSTAGCPATQPVVRSLAAGSPQSTGATAIYAGLAGSLDGGATLGGHLFATATANTANATTAWTDAAKGTVTNDTANAGLFNPGGFDISSITVDPHDTTGATVYATIMGFTGNGVSAPRLYRSTDRGLHWLNISANLPNAPANSALVDPNDANTLYIAMDTGVYVTTSVTSCTTANCWSVYGSALPNAPAIQLLAAAAMPTGDGRLGELRVGTYGRGIWQVPLLTAIAPAAPAIQISPSTVTYSDQQAGTASQPVTLTVTNTGNAPLTVSSIITTGDFTQTNTCTGTPIQQGASCTVAVTFAPTATGARTGLLTVYGDVAGGQATASLSGNGTAAAAVILTPTSLTFPTTSVGATSPSEIITVANTGGTVTPIQSIALTGNFQINANTCGTTLAPSTACSISIVFVPASSGQKTGTLNVVDGAGTQTASLTGTATTPATDTLAPTALTFAGQQLNTTSPTQSVTLTNAGDVPLTLIAASITLGDFTVVNGCGNSLLGHASCTLQVAYVPKSLGAQTGTLTVSDQFRTQTVTLAGTGLAPPGVSLSPFGGLSFAATGVNLTAPIQTVTLTNNGGVALILSGLVLAGDFSIAPNSNTCANTLAPSAVCTVGIAFLPTAAGPRTGSITFSDNAANSPQTLALTGTGIDFTLAPDGPTTMTLASGSSASYALLLSGLTGLPGSAVFACTGAPAHASCTVNPTSAGLSGTTVITVAIGTGLTTGGTANPWQRTLPWLAFLIPMGLLWKRRRPIALAALILLAAAGCSAGRILPGTGVSDPLVPVVTPSGTYNLTVTGTSAGLTRTVPLTLIVQ